MSVGRTQERIIKDIIEQTEVEHAIVVSAGESLPFGIQQLYFLKNPRPTLEKSVFQNWKSFLLAGKEAKIPAVKKDYQTLALISHTGGTTGEPKGVMCSDYNINALIWQIGCNLPHVRQEKYLVVLPPFINYSLINAMLEPLAFGFQVILIPDYKPARFADYVEKYRPNHISSIPPYWEVLLSTKGTKKRDFSSLDHIYYGGEAMPPETERVLNELLLSYGARHKLCKGVGQTEMMSAATVTYDDCNILESVGIPLVKVNCAIKPVHEDRECGYGEKGEICFSGPTLMMGYYHNQEETDDIINVHKDGIRWLHTGDIGYFNEDGILFITGRIKRILITKGKDGVSTKLFPDRVEKVINQHQAVALCCVIGIPDEIRVHYPKAFIVLKSGIAVSEVLTAEILQLCRDNLPDYMVPD